MKQLFNIPNFLTAFNLLSGILAIIFAFAGKLDLACYLIYLAAIFDFFDGFVARKLKISGELGKQMDSLADMVTFGVAPGILVFLLLAIQSQGGFLTDQIESFSQVAYSKIHVYFNAIANYGISEISLTPFTGLIIPFFSIFRLAKFNIDTRQSESFIGLNTPANTIFFTAFPLLYMNAWENSDNNAIIFKLLRPEFFVPLVVVMSLLLISEIPFFSLKFKDFSWKNNQIRFIFLGLCGLLIPLLLVWSIPIIIILYLLLSIIENQRKKQTT